MATEDLTFRFNVTGNAVPQFQAIQKQVRAVDNQVKRTTATVRDHANQYDRTAVATNKWAKGALQQAGYQIGDYAVQVANGTSAMQAFGQQGSQLLGVFGPIGAVLGAGVAIISAVAIAFEKTAEAAKGGSSAVMSFSDAAKSASEEIAKTRAEVKALTSGFRDVQEFKLFEGVQEAREELAQAEETAQKARFSRAAQQTKLQVEAAEKELKRREQLLQALVNQRATQEAIDRGMEAREAALARMKQLEEERKSAVQSIRDALTKETTALQNKINLARTELEFGKESAEFAALKAEQARASFKAEQESNGILGNNLRIVMDLYDEHVAVTGEVENAASAATGFANEMQRASREASRLMSSLASGKGLAAAGARLAGVRAEFGALESGQGELEAVMAKARAEKMAELGGTGVFQTPGAAAALKEVEEAAKKARLEFEASEFNEKVSKLKTSFEETGSVGGGAMERIKSKTKEVVDELKPLQNKMQSVGDAIASSMEGALMSIVDGTSSAKDAFRNMASSIIKELYRIFVVKRITGFISDAISSPFGLGGLLGPGMTTGTPLQVPSGSGESLLPPGYSGGGYTGNGARAGGLDGKGGFMAMMHPRETVIDHTKGQSAGGVVVNQTINVSTGVQQTVRTEIKSLMPQIAESAKSAVVDAKRRGGSYGRSFA